MADEESAGPSAATAQAPSATAPNTSASAQAATTAAALNSNDSEQDQETASASDDSDENSESVYSDESYDSDISEHTTYSLEEEGMCLWIFESAYLKPPAMSKYAWHCQSVNYDQCSSKDLKRFVVDRVLDDPYPEGITLKSLYIPILVEADKNKTFRFLDLPPELRNLVYEELLSIPDNVCPCHSFCFPQILRASHQIHSEASDIIYAVNNIKISIGLDFGPDGDTDLVHHMHLGNARHFNEGASQFYSLLDGSSAFPHYFRRVTALTIRIDVVDEWAYQGYECLEELCRCLLNLATFFMDGHHLQDLTIVFGPTFEHPIPEKVLFPLRRLRDISKFSVLGSGLAQSAIDDIAKSLRIATPVFNTYKQLSLCYDEVEAWMCLKSDFKPSANTLDPWDYKAFSRLVAVANSKLDAIQTFMWESDWLHEDGEKEVQDLLTDVSDTLDAISDSQMAKMVQQIGSATADRRVLIQARSSFQGQSPEL